MRVGLNEILVSGVMLTREGDDVVVKVERKLADETYQWVEVIRERFDSNFSHIVEPEGILTKFRPYV